MDTSNDILRLSEEIEQRIGYTLSTSTLRRLWGKVGNDTIPRETTLDLLSQFCGFANYRTFLADVCNVTDYAASHRILGTGIDSAQLEAGALLALDWNPNRHLVVRHSREGHFTILHSVGSKLNAGDTFHCDRMIIGEPCYIDNLRHDNGDPSYYVMGLQGGLTRIEKMESDD